MTIIACATGTHANSALAVIRLSGFGRLSDFQPLFSRSLAPLKARHMYRSDLLSRDTVLDDVCLCYFEGPASFTGENVLELYVHGNLLNINRIIDLFCELPSVRPARPGEFTRRALQNKKITLAQAEGLDLFLNAATPLALTQGLDLLHGELHQSYLRLYETFLRHKVSLELLLDFHDDVGESEAKSQLHATWSSYFGELDSLFRRISPQSSRLLRPEIVLAGLPNAGKSTLFNSILGERRAIVSSLPGTTRDYIAEDVLLHGVNYRLLDTAGIRNASDEVEEEGIGFSLARLNKAFFRLLVVNPFAPIGANFSEFTTLGFDGIFWTHNDLPGASEAISRSSQELLVLWGQSFDNHCCYNDLPALYDAINKKYLQLTSSNPLLLDRHKEVISSIYRVATGYAHTLLNESDIGILSHELNALAHCHQELLGIISPDEVLDHLFANFCIGK